MTTALHKAPVRPVLTLSGTFDHRVVDGYHLGRIAKTLRNVLENPARFLGAPHSGSRLPAVL